MEVPAGSPVALNASDCPLVLSLAWTGTDTVVPATPSCGPGFVIVTGWPSWDADTASVPDSGRLPSESPTSMP